MLGSVIGRHNAVMSRAELKAGDFFSFAGDLYASFFAFNCGVCLFFNTDMLHYLACCVLKLACCEPVVSLSYGSLGIIFRGRGCSPSCYRFNNKL